MYFIACYYTIPPLTGFKFETAFKSELPIKPFGFTYGHSLVQNMEHRYIEYERHKGQEHQKE